MQKFHAGQAETCNSSDDRDSILTSPIFTSNNPPRVPSSIPRYVISTRGGGFFFYPHDFHYSPLSNPQKTLLLRGLSLSLSPKFPCCSSNKALVCLSPEKVLDLMKHKQDYGIKEVIKDSALCYLPAKSLCRFTTVSKEWHQKITSPFLAHQQATHFKKTSGLFCQFPGESPSFISLDHLSYGVPCPSLSFLPEPVDVRTTCNGLLCCRSRVGENPYFVCNPVTKEWRMLPKPNLYHGLETAIALALETGVLNFASQHELICAVTLPDDAVLHFEIYSSRTDSWRLCQTVCCEMESLALNGDGFYANGIVYWETQSSAVLAFQVKDEEYEMFMLPFSSGPAGALATMHGELCYLLPRKEEDSDAYTIEVYGDIDMRLKDAIPLNLQDGLRSNGLCRVLSLVNDDTLVVDLGQDVIAYNLAAERGRRLSGSRTDGYTRYLPYVNTLVHVGHPVPMDEDTLYLLKSENLDRKVTLS